MKHTWTHDSNGYHVTETNDLGPAKAIILAAIVGGGLWALFFWATDYLLKTW
jgi:hypothetical protein